MVRLILLTLAITLTCVHHSGAVVRVPCVGSSVIDSQVDYTAKMPSLTRPACNTIPQALALKGFDTEADTQFHFPNIFVIEGNLDIDVATKAANDRPTRMNVSFANLQTVTGAVLIAVRRLLRRVDCHLMPLHS